MENNNRTKKSSSASSSTAGVVAIIVVGIFVLCVIFILAKGIFTSNSAEVPEGLDTGTINTNESSVADVVDDSNKATDADATISSTDSMTESGVTSDSTVDDTTSSNTESLGVMYIIEYAYLHTQPSNESENIVCMSPGVEVTVLEYEDNGYVKITFMNIDGQLTGYIYGDYLTTSATN